VNVDLGSEARAEKLLGQLHQWAMEAIEMPRARREAFIVDVAERYYDDAIKNGLAPPRPRSGATASPTGCAHSSR